LRSVSYGSYRVNVSRVKLFEKVRPGTRGVARSKVGWAKERRDQFLARGADAVFSKAGDIRGGVWDARETGGGWSRPLHRDGGPRGVGRPLVNPGLFLKMSFLGMRGYDAAATY